MPGERHDPLLGGLFKLDIKSANVQCIFSEASGFSVSIAVSEYRAVDERGRAIVQKQPGIRTYGDIVLRRGFSRDESMWNWVNDVLDGKVAHKRIDGSVVLLDQEGREQMRWNFFNAWPTKLVGPTQLNARSNEYAVEELTLAIERMERA